MARKRTVTERDPGPPRWHSRTVAGISLAPTRIGVNDEMAWQGIISGRVVTWVIDNQPEWKAKLRVRRKAGTRMVDPIKRVSDGAGA
jgi:hypothetical protein